MSMKDALTNVFLPLHHAAYIVGAVPAFPPTTFEEKQARAVAEVFLCVFPSPPTLLVFFFFFLSLGSPLLLFRANRVPPPYSNKPEKGVILEMCYHPDIWTELAQIAKDAGWNVVTGEQAMMYAPPSLPLPLPSLLCQEDADGLVDVRSWQGIEQQLLWLECEEKDLPVQEILDTVARQVASDKKTGGEPPQE